MKQEFIGNCMETSFDGEPFIEKFRKLRETCTEEGITFEGELYDEETTILCYINENVDAIYRKDNAHVYLRFAFQSDKYFEDSFHWRKIKRTIKEVEGIIKDITYIPQNLYLIEVHIVDRKFTYVIKTILEIFEAKEKEIILEEA